jgi:diketogulonate reductase-like aldo/keto reductase
MSSLADTYTLSNGVKIPVIGFGTWQIPAGPVAVKAVKDAIAAGYRHIDTATMYQNEESVGQAIRESGVPREALFLTTKLHNTDHGYEKTLKAFQTSTSKLGVSYLDLWLIHWPNPKSFRGNWQSANAGTWKAFEELYEAGKVKAIGVSNFRALHLEELFKTAKIKPHVNQIRLCPGDTQDDVVAFSRQHGMLLEAYSPLGIGKIFEVQAICGIAAKYGISVAQVAIRWSLQRGYLPLPKAATTSHIIENAKVFDFTVSDEDVEALAAMKGVLGYSLDPDTIPF